MLNDVEFREVGELVKVDKVKVVACDGKGLYDQHSEIKYQIMCAVEPLYYRHQGYRNKCLYFRGVCFRKVRFIRILVSQGPSEMSVIERCP